MSATEKSNTYVLGEDFWIGDSVGEFLLKGTPLKKIGEGKFELVEDRDRELCEKYLGEPNPIFDTTSENIGDPVKVVKLSSSNHRKGSHHKNSKLDEEKVLSIRESYKNGATYAELAEEYSVSVLSIQNVVKRRTWKHI